MFSVYLCTVGEVAKDPNPPESGGPGDSTHWSTQMTSTHVPTLKLHPALLVPSSLLDSLVHSSYQALSPPLTESNLQAPSSPLVPPSLLAPLYLLIPSSLRWFHPAQWLLHLHWFHPAPSSSTSPPSFLVSFNMDIWVSGYTSALHPFGSTELLLPIPAPLLSSLPLALP